jgi:drug/metabolite transporter (DMT)-like permease
MLIKSPVARGYAYAMGAMLSMAVVFILSKLALLKTDFIHFGFYWFGLAVIWNSSFIIGNRQWKSVLTMPKRAWLVLLVIGVFELAATYLFFNGIATIENPAVTSFINNIGPVFTTILGITLLQERFSGWEASGILMAFGGAFTISYQWGASIENFLIPGAAMTLGAAFLYSVSTITAKRFIGMLNPVLLSLSRAVILFIYCSIAIMHSQTGWEIPNEIIVYVVVGSLLGPFASTICHYKALQYIDAGKSTVFQSSRSFLILIFSFAIFGLVPAWYQLAGGVVLIQWFLYRASC